MVGCLFAMEIRSACAYSINGAKSVLDVTQKEEGRKKTRNGTQISHHREVSFRVSVGDSCVLLFFFKFSYTHIYILLIASIFSV